MAPVFLGHGILGTLFFANAKKPSVGLIRRDAPVRRPSIMMGPQMAMDSSIQHRQRNFPERGGHN